MLFIPLRRLSNEKRKALYDIYSRCERTQIYKDKNVASSLNVFVDRAELRDWIYENLISPLGIPRDHIKNNYKESRCCGINFNVFRPGGWCHPHRDLNPVKIHFLLKGSRSQTLFWPDQNTHWDYLSPALINVLERHTVTRLEQLTGPRIMLQIFLTHGIEEYAEILRRSLQ